MADYKLFWNNCKELGSAASESDEPCQRDGDRRNGAMTGTGADVSDVRLTDLDPSDGRTPRPVAADATEGDGMNPNEESLVCALKAAGTLNGKYLMIGRSSRALTCENARWNASDKRRVLGGAQ
ncbi:hypothetical protein PI124_g23225 [Phytophthora idaei]|nr:hypothetical protein PI126_g23229 [Phytophthora idaei]KAG3231680.1 hypothetical protein PI124_g23225 [Phytophthora idaei]